MATTIEAPRIRSRETPRQILREDFRRIPELPIHGGWGYACEDAVVIDRHDPVVARDRPFDGVCIEHVFVEKRIFEELIIFRPAGGKYSGIGWKLLRQSLRQIGGRSFDVLEFEVTAFPDAAWEALKAEWDGPEGFGSPGFDADAHERRREAAKIRYLTEYWFDITSFYGE